MSARDDIAVKFKTITNITYTAGIRDSIFGRGISINCFNPNAIKYTAASIPKTLNKSVWILFDVNKNSLNASNTIDKAKIKEQIPKNTELDGGLFGRLCDEKENSTVIRAKVKIKAIIK